MDGFNILLLEGCFNVSLKGTLQVLKSLDEDPIDVDAALQPFLGQQVNFAVHMVPPMPPDPKLPGGGCCHWEHWGECPAGHKEHPERLLNVHGEGTLVHKEGDWRKEATWWLQQFDGTELRLPLLYLPGHDARIACVPVFDAQKMREAVADVGVADIAAIGVQAENLKDILTQLQKVTQES